MPGTSWVISAGHSDWSQTPSIPLCTSSCAVLVMTPSNDHQGGSYHSFCNHCLFSSPQVVSTRLNNLHYRKAIHCFIFRLYFEGRIWVSLFFFRTCQQLISGLCPKIPSILNKTKSFDACEFVFFCVVALEAKKSQQSFSHMLGNEKEWARAMRLWSPSGYIKRWLIKRRENKLTNVVCTVVVTALC